jgi:hypothetical protein
VIEADYREISRVLVLNHSGRVAVFLSGASAMTMLSPST